MSLAEVIAELREEDRNLAKDKELDATGFRQKLLTRSDKLRDEILPRLGVRLEDRDQGSSKWLMKAFFFLVYPFQTRGIIVEVWLLGIN